MEGAQLRVIRPRNARWAFSSLLLREQHKREATPEEPSLRQRKSPDAIASGEVESEQCFGISLTLVCHAAAKGIHFLKQGPRLFCVTSTGGFVCLLYQYICTVVSG